MLLLFTSYSALFLKYSFNSLKIFKDGHDKGNVIIYRYQYFNWLNIFEKKISKLEVFSHNNEPVILNKNFFEAVKDIRFSLER